jgi:cytochrome P450
MEGFVRDLVIRFCTERLREGRADIVRDLAWELPALVLFRILGVPDDEVPRVKTGSWNRILFIYGRPTDVVQMQAAEGMAAFWRYAEGLVESRQKAPLEDFISDLVHAQDADGLGLTLPQAVAIGDVPVPAGAGLLLMLGAANCDPAVFPDPDRLDIRRTNAHEHLSFGSGPHFCLGAPLARLQGRVVLEVVSSRLPGLRLVDGAPLQFAPNVSFRGRLSLPVEWNV